MQPKFKAMSQKIITAIICFLLLNIFQIEKGFAQQRFKAGITIGLNTSQIDGDDTGGYNKIGLVGGLRGIAIINDKMELALELNYSQRGSKNDNTEPVDIEIKLNYVEVPVMFSYKDWYNEEEDYYKVQASGGLSYGRLLNTSAEGASNVFINEVENFSKDDISILLGGEIFLIKHLSLGLRWQKSLNLLYDSSKFSQGKNSLRSRFWTFRVTYVF